MTYNVHVQDKFLTFDTGTKLNYMYFLFDNLPVFLFKQSRR